MRREKDKTYRPPPPLESALFPHFAYKTKKRRRSSQRLPISKRQERNGTAHGDTAPGAKPVQQNSKGTESKKGSTQARQSAPADNSSTDHQWPMSSTISADKCRVCKKEGHWARDCKERQGIQCYRCGHPGVIVATCPNCSNSAKETESGNNKQSQSPSKSSALASVGSPIQSEKNLVKACFTSLPPCQTAAVGHVDNRLCQYRNQLSWLNLELHPVQRIWS